MVQLLDLELKLQPSDPHSLAHSTLHRTIAPPHLATQSEKGDSVDFDFDPRNQFQDDYPDGGLRAWLVVLGGLITVHRAGYLNSWGVFQDYYENDLLKGTSPSTIAWIGSVQGAFLIFPALISGRLFDIGYFRSTLIFASMNLVVCTLLVAECHEFWQLLLCQGFGVGIPCGLVYGPAMCVLAHWFKKRLSTALGIAAFATSIGGTVFPIVFRNLIITVGFKWTMRVFASILFLSMGVTNLTIRRRLPPTNISGGLFNIKQFKSPAFTVYTIAGFVLFFLPCSITNVGNAVGRIVSGFLADYFGPMNVMIPASLISGVLTIVWPYTRGIAALITIAVTYGASSGPMMALIGAPMMALGDYADVGRRTGMYLTIASVGELAGLPISGAINHLTGGYIGVGFFAGSSMIVGVFLLALSRYFVLGRWIGKA
ncbi:MFS general substrate transporter [Lactarius quietus]|nr:MFS general substrate transporter [Lactarius quietus]